MDNLFKVSVIIPCYNCEEYISKCLQALENQTYKDFEVLVVDDMSTDNSYCVLQEFVKNSSLNIRIFQNEKNFGPAVSRQKAVNEAKGEYVCFCDSDDWYDKDFIEKMFGAINKTSANIVICASKYVYPSGKSTIWDIRDFEGEIDVKKALSLFLCSLCTLMIYRELMLNCPNTKLRVGEDMALVPLLIAKANKCVLVNEPLYNYYQRPTSASNNFTLSSVESLLSCFAHIKNNLPLEFKKECEAMGIQVVVYSSIIALFSFSKDKKYANKIMDEFENDFPDWQNNEYLKNFPRYKKIVIKACKKRRFGTVKLLVKIKALILKLKGN